MRRVHLITGPPCAGKTTYAREHMGHDAVYLDQDDLGPKAMTEALWKLRTRTDGTFWVVRCAPGPRRRAALAEWLRAEVTHLQPAREVLNRRALSRPHPKRALQAVANWLRMEAQDPAPVPMREPGPRRRDRRGDPRHTRAHRAARAEMFATYGDVCWVCGHSGAGDAGHMTSLRDDPTQPIDPHAMRPVHGVWSRCRVCDRACNQSEGTKPMIESAKVDAPYVSALEW